MTGVDASRSGIEQATRHHAEASFACCDCEYGPALGSLGSFDAVVSIEVIEHVRSTRAFVRSVRDMLRPGGAAVVTTPYHGWLKRVLVAATARHDRHFDPLWEGGHIKFLSRATLTRAFAGQGCALVALRRVGRIAPTTKSIVAAFRRTQF